MCSAKWQRKRKRKKEESFKEMEESKEEGRKKSIACKGKGIVVVVRGRVRYGVWGRYV